MAKSPNIFKGAGKGRGLNRMPQAVSRMDVAIQRIDLLERGLADRSGAANFLLKEMKADILSALMASYRRSGLRRVSGGIASAIMASTINLVNGKVRIAFSDATPKDVIRRATSLNYGSVHQPRAGVGPEDKLGSRAKRTVKRISLEGSKLSKREARRFEKKLSQANVPGKLANVKNAFRMGTATVVAPKRFYFIGKADFARIQKKFSMLFTRWLERKVKAD